MPYITASIILQLMTSVYPVLKKIQEEGELGRRKITQYTRYLTVVLCLLQGVGISYWLQRQPGLVIGGGGFLLYYLRRRKLLPNTVMSDVAIASESSPIAAVSDHGQSENTERSNSPAEESDKVEA